MRVNTKVNIDYTKLFNKKETLLQGYMFCQFISTIRKKKEKKKKNLKQRKTIILKMRKVVYFIFFLFLFLSFSFSHKHKKRKENQQRGMRYQSSFFELLSSFASLKKIKFYLVLLLLQTRNKNIFIAYFSIKN